MFVTKLSIKNYRNYALANAQFSPHVNIFIGDNAQGKTNLLEAIYLASVGRSARTPRDKELIQWEKDKATVKIEVLRNVGSDTVEIVVDKAANKRIAINGMPIARMGELMGVIATVLFSPDEMRIVKESPSDRRRFIDIALCQISRAYFYLLGRYNKIVSQRNKLLKSGKATADSLAVWNEQLSSSGSKIIKTRRGYIERLNKFAAENHSYLTADKEKLNLSYEGIEGEDLDCIKANFDMALIKSNERDLYLGYTHVGPHKDDFSIKIDGIDVRNFGSQGQQRTASLSLKLAELDLMKAETGEYPILLLDDVLSELDKNRQKQLLNKISEFQTIITCTHMDDDLRGLLKDFKEFKVTSGKIEIV